MKYNLSIIITTFNEEKNIENCLSLIKNQKISKEINYEIVIVDDNSNDKTVDICRQYTNKIFFSGKKFCEISRYVGITKASYENILFLDADNFLTDQDLIQNMVNAHIANDEAVGIYPYRFSFSSNEPLINQYCSIYGINDPYQWHLKSSEHFSYFSSQDHLKIKTIKEYENYFKINFDSDHMYTLGAICFLTKKSIVKKYNQLDGYVFHSDVFNNLIKKDPEAKFILIKKSIDHLHSTSIYEYFKKIFRNGINYKKYNHLRTKNHWAINNINFYFQTLKMILFIPTLISCFIQFAYLRKISIFLHPFVSLVVPIIYIYIYLFYGKKKNNISSK